MQWHTTVTGVKFDERESQFFTRLSTDAGHETFQHM